DEILADPSVDAVEILTPTHLHHDHVLAAVEAGKHVSCQKPIANTVDEARAMTKAAEAAGVIFRISECFRHYPPLVRARQLIGDGAIGKPTHLRIRTVVGQTDSAFQSGLQADGYTWRMNNQSPGGHLFDDMIHKYAVALWLLDQDIVSVRAVVRRRDHFFEPCDVIFEYEDPSLLGAMEVSYAPKMWMRSSFYGADEFFEVQGDEGFIWVTRCTGELLDLPALMLYQGHEHAQTTTSFAEVPSSWDAGFDGSAHHFIDAILDGAPAEMSGDEATKALQLCFAVYEAGNTGGVVDPRGITGMVVPEGWPR
ncbi:MAG: Gfo/Idh/MocA family oxidoreductase, partial [Acidimicrobiales bacterium]|nr:Gfo/Idh/MocA family oxidoreductase [Acidimicrobiales bacterium]